ncbi:MAG: tetratricopeptide repeat protein [Thermodesulfovibrionales bacterium]
MIVIILLLIVSPRLSGGAEFDEQLKDPLLKKAWEELKVQKPDDAIKLLTAYTSDLQSAAHYHFIFGKALSAVKKPLEALQHYRLAYVYFPKGELKEISLINKGEAYLKLRNYYEASNDFAMFISLFPQSKYLVRAQAGLAAGLIGSDRLKEALQLLNKLDNNAEVLYTRASVMQRLGLVREAHDAYGAALAKDASYVSKQDRKAFSVEEESASPYTLLAPVVDETLYYIGENYRLIGKAAEAEKYLLQVSEPGLREKAAVGLGLLALKDSKIDKAMTLFNKALSSSDRVVRRQSILYLAEVEVRLGKSGEAKARLQELMKNYPNTPERDQAILKLSEIYIKDENHDEAMKVLKELIFRRYPAREAIDQVVAILRHVHEKKETEKLAAIWKSAGPWLLDNSREKFLIEMAEALKGTGKPHLDILRWLTKNGSDDSKGHAMVALALFYADFGDIARAKEYLGRIRNRKGLEDDILRLEAKTLMAEKSYGAASKKFGMIRKYRQEDLRPFGLAIGSSPDAAKVFARFEKAAAEAGGDAGALTTLADIAYALGKMKEANKYYRAVLAREPENTWCLYRVASMTTGGEAEELFRKASSGTSAISSLSGARHREMVMSKKYLEDSN